MKKRYAVLGLSVVLALSLAVPAFGGPPNPIANISKSAKSIAQKALKQAKKATKAANAAQNTANAASSAAAGAQSTASAASTAASNAQKSADTAKSTADTAQSTADTAKSTADTAKSTADTALSTANTAKSTATSAQTTANNALAAANGKMSGEAHVEGTEGSTLSIASCPSGKKVTGGGFIITGADNDAATVTENTQYTESSWIVIADQIEGTSGSTWGTVATVNCATSP